ncbi:hypothetical protein [Streptomyces sp. NPDC002851]
MRTMRISLRSGLAIAAVAAPFALAASPAAAAHAAPITGINVTVSGSFVQVTTTDCPNGGRASLMGRGNASFAGGEQVDLARGGDRQSASWQGVSPGTYTVAVICSGGESAGSQRVTVSGAPSPSPTVAPTGSPTAPTGQVRGGLGGVAEDDGFGRPGQIVAGAALATTVGIGGVLLMGRRRRSRRH